jgi:hypothetical protein
MNIRAMLIALSVMGVWIGSVSQAAVQLEIRYADGMHLAFCFGANRAATIAELEEYMQAVQVVNVNAAGDIQRARILEVLGAACLNTSVANIPTYWNYQLVQNLVLSGIINQIGHDNNNVISISIAPIGGDDMITIGIHLDAHGVISVVDVSSEIPPPANRNEPIINRESESPNSNDEEEPPRTRVPGPHYFPINRDEN